MKIFSDFKKEITEETEGISCFNAEAASAFGNAIGVDWDKISLDQLTKGLKVEYEEHPDVHLGNPVIAARIAVAHIKEIKNYYDLLEKMEKKNDK